MAKGKPALMVVGRTTRAGRDMSKLLSYLHVELIEEGILSAGALLGAVCASQIGFN